MKLRNKKTGGLANIIGEQAKAEARQNLSGEDLEKCYKALEAWARNTMTTVGWR